MSDPILIPNSFSSYKLTEEQELQGSVLTTDQKCVLQNKLAEIAEQKNSLDLDPNDVPSFIQQEAFLKGQLEIINWQIDKSNVAAEMLYNTISEED